MHECEMCKTFEGKYFEDDRCSVWLVKDGGKLHIELNGKPKWKCISYTVQIPFNYCPECGARWRGNDG